MDIIYLDQNKWIELARVQAGAVTSGPIAVLYQQLVDAVQAKRVLFPLSASHVIETSKQNDPQRRGHLAETQAKLSRGSAYRSRAARLETEVSLALHRIFDVTLPMRQQFWAIAPNFLEAFEPFDSFIAPVTTSEQLKLINAHIAPEVMYENYMKNQDDDVRRAAHVNVTAGIKDLVAKVESRRALINGESVDLRRRAYAVGLFIENKDLFVRILNRLGFSYEELQARGDQAMRSLIEDVPTLDVESRMVARLEAENGGIKPNDVFDIQAFYTAIPYSSWVVAEKGSISRAQQAKLDIAYKTKLSRSLEDLMDVYSK
jgi:hypothetical protein